MTDPKGLRFAYRRRPDQALSAAAPAHHPVVIAGAGPVGLAAALDLARKGQKVVLLDPKDRLSDGSRAICWSKRTLEIMDRLGVGDRLLAKGVTWQKGKVFFDERLLYEFDLMPESGHKAPAFINLQQYYFELACIEAAEADPRIDLRWGHGVAALDNRRDGARLTVATEEGTYALTCDWLLAADGCRSPIRKMLRLDFAGQVFDDQFLIADVRMKADFPTERWFWFDPPFNRGQSALLHKQPDDVWRIDLQLGSKADAETARRPENVLPRLTQMLGPHRQFELEWVSVYHFQCRRLRHFVHGRTLFIGDAAHQVSPFGARGGNSGIQDVDNLVWKLDLVLRGLAPETLIASYDDERIPAADENILNSTRASDFISPHGPVLRSFRDAALTLAERDPFARSLVNSGRLSRPHAYRASPLSGPDELAPGEGVPPGAPAADAPLGTGWLLNRLGDRFVAAWMTAGGAVPMPAALAPALRDLAIEVETLIVEDELAGRRYGAAARPALYLFRPDQHVAARWRQPTPGSLRAAVLRATGTA